MSGIAPGAAPAARSPGAAIGALGSLSGNGTGGAPASPMGAAGAGPASSAPSAAAMRSVSVGIVAYVAVVAAPGVCAVTSPWGIVGAAWAPSISMMMRISPLLSGHHRIAGLERHRVRREVLHGDEVRALRRIRTLDRDIPIHLGPARTGRCRHHVPNDVPLCRPAMREPPLRGARVERSRELYTRPHVRLLSSRRPDRRSVPAEDAVAALEGHRARREIAD